MRFIQSGFFWLSRCPSHTWAHIKYPSRLCVCTRLGVCVFVYLWKYDNGKQTQSVRTAEVRHHIRLALVTFCVRFPKNITMMYQCQRCFSPTHCMLLCSGPAKFQVTIYVLMCWAPPAARHCLHALPRAPLPISCHVLCLYMLPWLFCLYALTSWPCSALRNGDVVEYSEVADSVHARTCPQNESLSWHLRSLLPWQYSLQTWACQYVSLCSSISTVDCDLFWIPWNGWGRRLLNWPRGDLAKGIPRVCQSARVN